MDIIYRWFKSSDKLELLYNLLVKDILKENDVDLQSFERRIIEMNSSFAKFNDIHVSYYMQTGTKLIITSGLLAWFVYESWDVSSNHGADLGSVMCFVYDYWYECSGYSKKLYLFVTCIASSLLLLHILLNIVNLVWLISPNVGALSHLMSLSLIHI